MTELVKLNDKWWIDDDPLQWILKRRKSKSWRGRSFCRTRKALIRCIDEYVKLEPGEDPGLIEAAVARVRTWPEMHVARPEPLEGVVVERQDESQVAEESAA